jgi:REP element-mobilizing transposase RayT
VPFTASHRRTPQKRFHFEGAQYFVTSVTRDRYPFFAVSHIAQVFVEDLRFACGLKELELFGYTVLPDHVHILFQPPGGSNCSEAVGSLKRNASRDINDLLSGKPFVRNLYDVAEGGSPAEGNAPSEGDDSNRPLHLRRLLHNFHISKRRHPHLTFDTYKSHFDRLESIRQTYEPDKAAANDLPYFRWQKSFRDHIIRDQRDFDNHIQYIYNNAVKHKLAKSPHLWPWMWVESMTSPLSHEGLMH